MLLKHDPMHRRPSHMKSLPSDTSSSHRLAAAASRIARAGLAVGAISAFGAVAAASLYTEATRAPDQP
jgi:hypothetical protein